MKKELLLGIDFGTGGCKVTVLNASGRLVASCSREYPTIHQNANWAEQNPSDWYRVMCLVLEDLWNKGTCDPQKIAAMSLDSYTHGAVLLDEKCKVIRPTIIWTDQRSVAQCEYLNSSHRGSIFETTYQTPAPTWTLPQLMWLGKNEPESLRRTRHVLFVKDYVRYLLTGHMAVDHIEAQGTLLWDMKTGSWSEQLCEMAGITPSVLPRIVKPTDCAGTITPQASRDTQIPEGVPVIVGTSDSAIEAFAAGAINPGQCVLKLATAGNVNVMTAEPHPNEDTLTYGHVVSGMWYTVTATSAAAVCQRWFRDVFCQKEIETAAQENASVYTLLNGEAEKSPAGANGLFFHPYLMGERCPYWDPDLRGSFTGLSMASSKSDICRALLEGVAYSLKDCYRTIEHMAIVPDEFILIGGGAKSRLWSQIVCDVFGVPIKSFAACDASLGSAMLAGVGAGVFADEKEAVERCVDKAVTLDPIPSHLELYSHGFRYYRKIHDALAEVYHEIHATD